MKLSVFTDNSLKVLLYLATHPEQRSTRHEIASYFELSEEHLRKVVHQLGKWGYVQTYAGRHGGMELAMPTDRINIGEVIRQSEHQEVLFDCVGQNCRLLPGCSLNRVLLEAQKTFLTSLSAYTLADLVRHKQTRNALLA